MHITACCLALTTALIGPATAQSNVYPELPIVVFSDLRPLASERGWAVTVAAACDGLSTYDAGLIYLHLRERANRNRATSFAEHIAYIWQEASAQAGAELAKDRAGTCRKARAVRPSVDEWRKSAVSWLEGN